MNATSSLILKLSILTAVLLHFISAACVQRSSPAREGGANADVRQWQVLYEAGAQARSNGHTLESQQLLADAVKKAECLEPPEEFVIKSLLELGAAYADSENYQDAEATYGRCLSIHDSTGGSDTQAAAEVLARLGKLSGLQSKHVEAETYSRKYAQELWRVFTA